MLADPYQGPTIGRAFFMRPERVHRPVRHGPGLVPATQPCLVARKTWAGALRPTFRSVCRELSAMSC